MIKADQIKIIHKLIYEKNGINKIRLILYYLIKEKNIDIYFKILKSKLYDDDLTLFNKIINRYPLNFNKYVFLKYKKCIIEGKGEYIIYQIVSFFILSRFKIKFLITNRNKIYLKSLMDFLKDKNLFLFLFIENHVNVYYKGYIYDARKENSKLYTTEETCFFNCLCFILDKCNINFNLDDFIKSYKLLEYIFSKISIPIMTKYIFDLQKYTIKTIPFYKKILKIIELDIEKYNN